MNSLDRFIDEISSITEEEQLEIPLEDIRINIPVKQLELPFEDFYEVVRPTEQYKLNLEQYSEKN